MYLTKELNHSAKFVQIFMSIGSSLGSERMQNQPDPHDTCRLSIFFRCTEEIAWLPVGEILEDRDGDGGQDAQVRTGALPAALCTIISNPYSKHG